MRAQQASTLADATLSRNIHLNRKNLLKITLLGYALGRAKVAALSRMSIPRTGFGDGGAAETVDRRRWTASGKWLRDGRRGYRAKVESSTST